MLLKLYWGMKIKASIELSQGGQLVHNAAKMMTAAQTAAVSSGKIFTRR
jgi:hypothetical protein